MHKPPILNIESGSYINDNKLELTACPEWNSYMHKLRLGHNALHCIEKYI